MKTVYFWWFYFWLVQLVRVSKLKQQLQQQRQQEQQQRFQKFHIWAFFDPRSFVLLRRKYDEQENLVQNLSAYLGQLKSILPSFVFLHFPIFAMKLKCL